jgi:hypothetical protein
VEALDLAVRAWSTRPRGQVPDPALAQELAQAAVERVAPMVVRHQPLRLDPVRRKDGECPLHEPGDRRRALVVEQLGIAEPRVVVDDRVRVVVADPRSLLGRGRAAITGHGMARPVEARVQADVHVQQIARTGPFVAAPWVSLSLRRPRQAVPAEHLRDRRVRMARVYRQQPRPPTRPPPGRHDPPLLGHG